MKRYITRFLSKTNTNKGYLSVKGCVEDLILAEQRELFGVLLIQAGSFAIETLEV